LSADERYLVEAYAKLVRARSAYISDPERAESLFAVVDSTIDSTRIANTMKYLDAHPERWLAIYRELDRKLRLESSAGP